ARPPSTTGAPKRTSGDRRAGPTAREAGERTVPCRGFSTGPHRSRRSGVAFQGRSWSPGATLGVPLLDESGESERGAGAGAKGSGNRFVPLVGGSADGSSPALTAPCCPPRDGDEGPVPVGRSSCGRPRPAPAPRPGRAERLSRGAGRRPGASPTTAHQRDVTPPPPGAAHGPRCAALHRP